MHVVGPIGNIIHEKQNGQYGSLGQGEGIYFQFHFYIMKVFRVFYANGPGGVIVFIIENGAATESAFLDLFAGAAVITCPCFLFLILGALNEFGDAFRRFIFTVSHKFMEMDLAIMSGGHEGLVVRIGEECEFAVGGHGRVLHQIVIAFHPGLRGILF